MFALALVPFALLVARAFGVAGLSLGANPVAEVTHQLGLWGLNFLLLTLAITPLRRLTGWHWTIRFRRMFGLFAFFYGSLHFLVYVIADRFAGLDFPDGIVSWTTVRNLAMSVGEDIYKRPFITIGFTTLMLMLPLAITSTSGWIRRLGGKRWNLLHRLVYVAGITAVVHYYWLVKADISSPLRYAAVVAALLAFRLYWSRVKATSAIRVGQQQPAARRA